MTSALKVFAGSEALAHIHQHGLKASDIAMVLAASGGPKWLTLAAMDRYWLSEWFQQCEQPLHLLGTSAGAWRLACFAQDDPLAAHERFLEAYISQNYSAKPNAQEVAAGCRGMLQTLLGADGSRQIVQHPFMRYHTLATRCRGLARFDSKLLQSLGLLAPMGANLVTRKAMRPWLQRTLFHHPQSPPIHHFPHLPAQRVTLTEQNLPQALLATGAIPLTIAGVRQIAGAPPGTYRDGGITDYQFDLPILPSKGLVLYPHYFARAPKPGWFDKKLPWRQASAQHYRRTIMLTPSWQFAATLPGGRIPDLQDFYAYPDYATRHRRWLKALSECQRLADELADIDQQQRWAQVVEPLPW